MASEEDSANFWKVASDSEDEYWKSYEATRPNYRDSGFFDIIYSYHLSKGASTAFNVAHDVGCGSGVVASHLATRFAHVIASDNNCSSLDAARRFLATTLLASKFSSSLCTGEDLAKHHAPQSADFIGAAECLPLMDADAALEAFATVLKPGGTLAIWFYGRPHFSEPEFARICQPLFDSIMDRAFSKVINGFGPERTASWKRTASAMASWLDYLDFPTGSWEKVQRWKWNSKSAALGFFTPDACDFEIETMSNVTDAEELLEKEDPQMWGGSWDIEGVKRFVDFSFPNIQDKVNGDVEIERLFGELENAMSGKKGDDVRSYKWPIVLILATATK